MSGRAASRSIFTHSNAKGGGSQQDIFASGRVAGCFLSSTCAIIGWHLFVISLAAGTDRAYVE
jgi:preprotein translocase subunit SecG